MSAKQNLIVNKAKQSIAKLQNRASSFKKQLPFSNDNFIGKLAQIQAWENVSLGYNQYNLGCHE